MSMFLTLERLIFKRSVIRPSKVSPGSLIRWWRPLCTTNMPFELVAVTVAAITKQLKVIIEIVLNKLQRQHYTAYHRLLPQITAFNGRI